MDDRNAKKKKKIDRCVGVSGAITESTWSTDQETVSIVERTRGTYVYKLFEIRDVCRFEGDREQIREK